jgi:ribosomal protein S12 methylthiotransferase accessory factor
VREILSRLEAASVKAYIKDITSDVGIPTFAAAMDDEVTKDPALLSLGVGTHLVPEIAALRALTEAAQSRLTTIHGTREDTFKAEYARRIGYDRLKRINRRWFAPSEERVRLADLESRASNDFLVDIEYTVKRLGGAGLREVIVVDLTRENVGIPAVRVLVPGLAVYALDKERTGNRLRTAIAGILRKGQ